MIEEFGNMIRESESRLNNKLTPLEAKFMEKEKLINEIQSKS